MTPTEMPGARLRTVIAALVVFSAAPQSGVAQVVVSPCGSDVQLANTTVSSGTATETAKNYVSAGSGFIVNTDGNENATSGTGYVTFTAGSAICLGPGFQAAGTSGGGGFHAFTTTSTADFSLAVQPGTQTASPGGSATYTVQVSSINGFAGAVSLAASGLPSGATAAFSPATITGSGTAALTITTAAGTGAGNTTLTVSGTSAPLSHSTTAVLTVTTSGNFSITSTPLTQRAIAGTQTTYAVSTTALSGFSGTVALSLTGLPTGTTASFNPASVSAGQRTTLSITTTGSTPVGSSTLTLTAVSGSISHTLSLTLVVGSPADFSLSSTPETRTISAGAATSYSISVANVNGFSGTVTFSAAGLPTGATASFSPTSVTGSGTSVLTITTGSGTPNGNSDLTITGTSGSISHTAGISLTVGTGTDFLMSESPGSRTVLQGGNTTYTVSASGLNGFSGTVTLSASGLPSGASASFSPASLTIPSSTQTSTLTISTVSSAPKATATIKITGASGALSHSQDAVFIIDPPGPAVPVREYIRMLSRVIAIESSGAAEVVSPPSFVSGPAAGSTSTNYVFSTGGSVDSNGGSVQYQFFWGDNTSPSGWLAAGTTTASHSFTTTGSYQVTTQARATANPSLISAFSNPLNITIAGESVSQPNPISGPTNQPAGSSYSYSTGGSTSTLGNAVQYHFDWGDGSITLLPSGTTSASHQWSATGNFTITVVAISSSGVTSPARTLSVAMTDPVPVINQITPWGTGVSQSFQISVIDYAGTSAIQAVQPLFSTSVSPVTLSNSCHMQYTASNNTLSLDSSAGNYTWVGSSTPGGSWTGTNANGICLINSWSVASYNQTNLVLTVAITFQKPNATWYEVASATNAQGSSAWATNNLTWTTPQEAIAIPQAPSGSQSLTVNGSATYVTGGSSSNFTGNSIVYGFNWGDGSSVQWLSAGATSTSHTWAAAGTYNVTALAKDTTSSVVSGSSAVLAVTVSAVVTQPGAPTISGPTSGLLAGTNYTYTASGSGSAGTVQYFFDWGDGTNSGWLSPGTTAATHKWTATGTFTITAKAASANAPSNVSPNTTLSVSMGDPTPVLNAFTPSGEGSTQTFNISTIDYAGTSALLSVQPIFAEAPSTNQTSLNDTNNSCHLYYDVQNQRLWLDGPNAGFNWVGSSATGFGSNVGGSWSPSNSNGICQINSWSFSTFGGTNLLLTINITFPTNTSFAWYEYMSATNNVGVTNWGTNGLTWIAP